MPAGDAGAPLPVLIADEDRALLAYFTVEDGPASESVVPRSAGCETDGRIAVIEFCGIQSVMFGAPGDETLHGHPLWNRGLSHYGTFEVEHSSWKRRLAEINSVHPRHNPERLDACTHFLFAFHDSTFECVAASATATIQHGTLAAVVRRLVDRLHSDS